MTDLASLAAVPERLADVPPEDLPGLAGEAAALHARILARLMVPPAVAPMPETDSTPDRLLSVKEAAQRLGVSTRWIYRRGDTLPWLRRVGGTLRAESRALERWIKARSS